MGRLDRRDQRHLVVHEVKAKRTPKLVRTAERHSAWGWATNLRPDEVHFSKEDAVGTALRNAVERVGRIREDLVKAEAYLVEVETLAEKVVRSKGRKP